jgi:glycosyltransferase involved in cell wall biosynthesis
MPLVSVVLIFLNEECFLEEAVHSVRNQTLTDWELILVDDGSADRSMTIARDFAAADERIRYVDHAGHQNKGMSASRNVGAAHASAPYLAFLDGDDVWERSKLAEQVELLESMPDVALVCGAMRYWRSWDSASTDADRVILTGGIADRRLEPPEAALMFHPLGRGDGSGVDVLVRRGVFDAVGGFEERFRGLFEDQAFLIKIFLRYPIYVSSQPWLRYRQHDASCIGQTSRVDYWRLRLAFLDWLAEHTEHHEDSRVSAAVRRARREVSYRRVIAPARAVYDRISCSRAKN